MFDNINLYKPDSIIRCKDLEDSSEIYSIMQKMGALHYAYCIAYIPNDELRYNFLKIGISSPDPERVNKNNCGERLVRQIANLPGWSKEPKSANGRDFSVGFERLQRDLKVPSYVNRNHIIVGIWNLSPSFRVCKVDAPKIEQVKWVEGELCLQYKQEFNDALPPLNHIDPSNSPLFKKHHVAKDTMATLFQPPTGAELFEHQ